MIEAPTILSHAECLTLMLAEKKNDLVRSQVLERATQRLVLSGDNNMLRVLAATQSTIKGLQEQIRNFEDLHKDYLAEEAKAKVE